jgi:hypothetical protein
MKEWDDTTVSTNTLCAITHLLTAILRGEENTVVKLCTSDIVCKFGSQIEKGNGASGGIFSSWEISAGAWGLHHYPGFREDFLYCNYPGGAVGKVPSDQGSQ